MQRNNITSWCIDKLITSKWIKIVWPRGSGKTTALYEIYETVRHTTTTYLFNFDEYIIAKQFHDAESFLATMRHEYGMDPTKPCLLFLNEIQYSKHIEEIIKAIITHPLYHVRCVTTSISGNKSSLDDTGVITSVCIYPFSFAEYSSFKQLPFSITNRKEIKPHTYEYIKPYLIDFLANGGYPAIIAAPHHQEKYHQTQLLLRKLFDKDIWLHFSREKVILYEEYFKTIALSSEYAISPSKLLKKLRITPSVLEKFELFSMQNYLITYLKPFFTNKERELSHKSTPIFLDNCFISYYNARMHTTNFHLSKPIILGYLVQELLKQGYNPAQLMTYQKTNGSGIDCLIMHDNGMITPIVILDHYHPVRSKALYHFIDTYKERISTAIEISPRYLGDHLLHGKEVRNIPSMLLQI